jgi:tetratricopeptide (TPR) repeat protein
MQIKGRRWNMRQPRRRSSLVKYVFLLGMIAFLVYVNVTVEPLAPTLFVATPTATISPEMFIAQAEQLANEGKYNLAIQAYNKAVSADPQNSGNYLALARLNIYNGEYEKAVENASNAVLLNPNSSLGEALKGFAQGLMGDYLESEGSLNRAIELDPANTSAYAYLSLILSQKIILGEETLGDLDRSIEASRKAESIAPDSLESRWARGVVLEITSNYEEAIAELERAVELNSNIAELHIALGRNYRFIGENTLAVEEFTRANSLNPSDPYPDTLISRTYANIGEFARAIQYAEQAVADDRSDPYLYGNLGVMYKQNFEFSKAILMLKLAVRGGLTPEGVEVAGLPLSYGRIVEYYYNYGLALMEQGYCGEAVDIAQSILQSMESDAIATYNANFILDRCFEKMNDLQLLKLPTPTMIPTWTPQPSPTPTAQPTQAPTATPIP